MIALPDAAELFAQLQGVRGRAREGLLTLAEVREFVEGVGYVIGKLPSADDVAAVIGRRWGEGLSRHVDCVDATRALDPPRLRDELRERGWTTAGGSWWPPC